MMMLRRKTVPILSADDWSLLVEGLADGESRVLTLADLRAFPLREETLAIENAGNPPGGDLLHVATWRGLRLADLLANLAPNRHADRLKLTGADGYQTAIPLSLAHDPAALLAFGMHGHSLAPAEGGPVRVILPDVYDYKQPKWLVHMSFIPGAFLGFWESRGWPDDGRVQPRARILAPQTHTQSGLTCAIRGDAFAGARRIQAVEVRIDGGPWLPARLDPTPRHMPTPWALDWTFTEPGYYTLEARATDENGTTQPATAPDPFAVPPILPTTHHVTIQVGPA
ncbi:MAG: molybdopterin-dependent oxidoreductase [Anaerolineales bacterium]